MNEVIPKHLNISVQYPHVISSRSDYEVVVKVENIGASILSRIEIENARFPGSSIKLMSKEQNDLDDLLNEKAKLLNIIEYQVKRAFEINSIESLDGIYKYFYKGLKLIDLLLNRSTYVERIKASVEFIDPKSLDSIGIPEYARSAIKVKNVSDIETVEKMFVLQKHTPKNIKTCFDIDKLKLIKLNEKIEEKILKGEGVNLAPNSSMNFPFRVKSPFVAFENKYRYTLQIKAVIDGTQNEVRLTEEGEINIYPSWLLIMTSGVFGALIGFGLKVCLNEINSELNKGFWFNLIASLFVGSVFTAYTSSSEGRLKFISTSNIIGGMIVGFLGGYFTEKIILKLGTLIG